jgi:hypothetical protein
MIIGFNLETGRRLAFLFLAILSLNTFAEEDYFTSKNSTEAMIEFDGEVVAHTNARNAIDEQLKFMVGTMAFSKIHAVPKPNYEISNIRIFSNAHIHYHYKGIIILENDTRDNYNIILPLNPFTIYREATKEKIDFCTDQYHQVEESFWYFWSPDRPGCKLVVNKDYLVLKASIHRRENTKLSFPEYKKLPNSKGEISVSVFFGKETPNSENNPLVSDDANAINYKTMRWHLLSLGYKNAIWKKSQIETIIKQHAVSIPFIETFKRNNIEYRVFFGDTDLGKAGKAFHWFYKDAIEKASVVIYAGHSGLGKRLDIESIEESLGKKIIFNLDRYQIFFIDSCSSYLHYTTMYLNRKKSPRDLLGTKKLDMITTGLPTYFNSMGTSSIAFVDAFESALTLYKATKFPMSYQELLARIDNGNLVAVTGDEDNL